MGKIYIHYNRSDDNVKFDINRFQKITNVPMHTKPMGGFWGSPIDCEHGWKWWCESEGMTAWVKNKTHYNFIFKNNSKIIYLKNILDILCLNRFFAFPNDDLTFSTNISFAKRILSDSSNNYYNSVLFSACLNFEAMLASGIDAVDVEIDKLHHALYGWDCDSVLVLNPDVIVIQ